VEACVVLKADAATSEGERVAWRRERMAHFKCPMSVDFVADLPRNLTGKILKRVLRGPYWQGQERSVH
jgi:acyl-coenzyme A synthetase/AMP-(fatty) acid ligase